MAMTHDDKDAELSAKSEGFLRQLERRAEEMTRAKRNIIAAGKTEEAPIFQYQSHSITVTKMPDDEQGVIRISIGGGMPDISLNYLVFRGDREKCVDLLRRALLALEGPKQNPESLDD